MAKEVIGVQNAAPLARQPICLCPVACQEASSHPDHVGCRSHSKEITTSSAVHVHYYSPRPWCCFDHCQFHI